jgi:hypothetical protein
VSLLQIISHSLIIILDQTCIDNSLLLNILLGFRWLALPTMFQEQRFCSIIVKILVLKGQICITAVWFSVSFVVRWNFVKEIQPASIFTLVSPCTILSSIHLCKQQSIFLHYVNARCPRNTYNLRVFFLFHH